MEKKFNITGMTCAACSAGIQKTVGKLKGVEHAEVSLMGECMTVEYDESVIGADDIVAAVVSLGYGASLADGQEQAKREPKTAPFADDAHRLKVRFFASLCFLVPLLYCTMAHMFGAPLPRVFDPSVYPANFGLVQLLLASPILAINFAFFRSGIRAAVKRVPNMDTLVSLGALVAYGYSIVTLFLLSVWETAAAHERAMSDLFFESAAMVLTLVTLGKWLEARSKRKTGEEVEKLLGLVPASVTVVRDGVQVSVPPDRVAIGDIVLVRQGDSIPVDGVVVEGESFVDKSAITGESLPVEVCVGDFVTSASINRGNFLKVRAEKVGEDTVLSRIVKMVQQAGTTKAPIEKTVDKIAGIFVPVVLLIALVTLAVWIILRACGAADVATSQILRMAISVLVISCPCALGLATPVAVMAATGRGASLGILFKDAEALQKTKSVRTVLLDKTATLTEGKPRVFDCIAYGRSREEVLAAAAGMETFSNHPLANCLVEYVRAQGVPFAVAQNFAYRAGFGAEASVGSETWRIGNRRWIEGGGAVLPDDAPADAARLESEGKTVLYLSAGNVAVALFGIGDPIKEGSAEAVRDIAARGMTPVMLTGDSRAAARAIAAQAGIEQVKAEVLPEEKLAAVIEYKSEGMTAMVGDGINDSPALKEADVGIAMGNGTDVAIESADVVLVGGDLRALPAAVDLSRAAVRNIHQNLFWAFIYNALCIPIAAGVLYPLGVVLDPMFGALAMSLSSVFVVTNALRLMRFRPRGKQLKINAARWGEGEKTMQKILMIEGMKCEHCSARVEAALNAIKGVQATVELKKKRAIVQTEVSDDVLVHAVEEAGYTVKKIR